MINILPTELKAQLNYSQRNVILRRYLLLILLVGGLLMAAIGTSCWYGNHQVKQLEGTLSDRQKQRANYKETEVKVANLQANINLIEKLLNQKTQFSILLSDLAAVLPPGSYINNINLTGDDKKPLELMVTATSLEQAGVIKNALLTSPRISTADIQDIALKEKGTGYNVKLIVAFKEGQAR